MRRSSRRHNALVGASRSDGRRLRPGRIERLVRVVPERDSRLSEGTLVEAVVQARLLGAPILRLDARVVLTPAKPEPVAPIDTRPARSSNRSAARARTSSPNNTAVPAGSALAEAVTLVEQSAASLRSVDGTQR